MGVLIDMAEYLHIRMKTDLAFCETNVRSALQILADAVADNWRNPELRDEWSDETPSLPIRPEEWAASLPYSVEFENWIYMKGAVNLFSFDFSPLSSYVADVVVRKENDGSLTVVLIVVEWILYETRGCREINRMELEWREIRQGRGESEPTKTGPDEDHPEYWLWWEKYDMLHGLEIVWPQNQQALFHIVEKLDAALTITQITVDDEIWKNAPAERRAAFVSHYSGRFISNPEHVYQAPV
jgi:hypothetical protein